MGGFGQGREILRSDGAFSSGKGSLEGCRASQDVVRVKRGKVRAMHVGGLGWRVGVYVGDAGELKTIEEDAGYFEAAKGIRSIAQCVMPRSGRGVSGKCNARGLFGVARLCREIRRIQEHRWGSEGGQGTGTLQFTSVREGVGAARHAVRAGD